MRQLGLCLGVLSFGFFLAGCNAKKNQTNIELIQNMMDQISIKSQDGDPLTPPDGTRPQGFEVYRFKGDPLGAEASLQNPLAGKVEVEILQLGRKNYEIYCSVCHGSTGSGDGPVAEKMGVRPPSLLTDKIRAFKDGRIYHIIVDGQGVMGSYAAQITDPRARWALVNYIRSLDKKARAVAMTPQLDQGTHHE